MKIRILDCKVLEQNKTVNLIKQFSLSPMQELGLSIQQRINKTKQVIENNVGSETIRSLREEEKIRCEKENFILAMMRANKIMSSTLKKSYIRVSQEMMTLLQPSFSHKQEAKTDQDFLNQFVHLYTSFFAYFEDKFTFKTKIKNFLRPTNIQHNLIVDLIKYFVDFTRDYYVQTLFWKMRNSSKIQNSTELFEEGLMENSDDAPTTKVKPLGPLCKNFSCSSEIIDGTTSPRKRHEDIEQKRNNQKNYDILQVSIPSITLTYPKQNFANIESLKIKINELFREQKSRNGSLKKIYENYFVTFNEKFHKLQNQSLPVPYLSTLKRSDHLNAKCHPIKLFLSVQKYGFSLILLQVENKKAKNCYLSTNSKLYVSSNNTSLSNSPTKLPTQSNLSPLKITQRVTQGQDLPKGDYFLTSMKVLRVSQNFLPPLVSSNILFNKTQSNSRKQTRQFTLRDEIQREKSQSTLANFSLKLRKTANEVEPPISLISEMSNSNNVLLRSTSFKHSSTQKDKKRLEIYNTELYSGQYICPKQSREIKLRRKDSVDSNYRLSNKKVDIKKKLIQQRKSYENGTYFNAKYSSKQSSANNYESEEKILQWLQKIKNLKQIERRKILGMNY